MALSQAYPSCFYLQFSDENGKPLANGSIKTFLASDHSMPVQTWTYPGSGVKNPTVIPLDAAGRCTMALENGLAYYIELYDSQGANKGTWDNVTSGGGTGSVDPSSGLTFTSSDGSITITRNGNNVDLKVTGAEAHYGTISASGLTNDGKIDFDTIVAGNITLAQESLEVNSGKLYHVTLMLSFDTNTLGADLETCVVTDSESGTHECVIDESIPSNIAELSWDITPSSDLLTLSLSIPENISLSSAVCYIHKVGTTVGGSGGGDAPVQDVQVDGVSVVNAQGIAEIDLSDYAKREDIPTDLLPPSTSEDAGKVLTVDAEGDPSWENPGSFTQVQADWNQTNTSAPDYIKNKPSIPSVHTRVFN